MEEQKEPLRPCGCGAYVVPRLAPSNHPDHYARQECPECGRYMGWGPKPENKDKKKRPSRHRNLVSKYSRGFCELCLRTTDDLAVKGRYLIGHHVIEFADDGEPSRDNVWIVCNSCHTLINWMRTHHGRNVVEEVATHG